MDSVAVNSVLERMSGGTSPYNYTWSIDGSISGYGQSFSFTFDSQGTYTVILTVRDAFLPTELP